MLFKREGHCQRLLVRLSHAIYDGMCLPIFWKDLKAAYDGEPLSQAAPFHHFVRSFSAIDKATAKAFWRDLLCGSSMTAVVARKHPTYTNSWNNVQERSILHLPPVRGSYTVSTVLLAAWSTTLALLSGSSDVVYGYLVAGRTSSHHTDATGPCVNILAMRTRLAFDQAVLGLLAQIRSAQVSSMPHDFVGWQHTVEECTDWPMWTRFSSVVHYQNLPQDPAIESIGGAPCKISSIGQATDRCDVWVEAFPQGSGLTVQVLSNKETIPEGVSRHILESLCSLV
ncbi:CoA-dependent acyltransferase, partial [Polyplosphaeria fusca]